METSAGRLTPFMLFYTEHRDAVKARINRAAARPEDISKEITRLWRSLAPERTRDYCLLSNLYAESLAKHGRAARAVKSGCHSGGNANTNTTTNSSSSSSSSSSNPNKRKLGKQPRRKKDPRLPKPPVSSFMWFSRHHRAILKNEHRELSFCEIGKTVGVLWKAAAIAEKRPFDDLAAEDKTRYARELAEYKLWLVKTQDLKDGEEDGLAAAAGATVTAATPAAAIPAAGATTPPPPPMRPSTSSLVPASPSSSSSSSAAAAAAASVTVAAATATAAPVSPVPVVLACVPSVPENGGRRAAVGVSSAPERFSPHPSSFSPSSFSPSEYSQHMLTMHSHKRQRREREEPALHARAANLSAVPMSHASVLDVVADSGGVSHLSRRQHIGGKAENVVMLSRSTHYRV